MFDIYIPCLESAQVEAVAVEEEVGEVEELGDKLLKPRKHNRGFQSGFLALFCIRLYGKQVWPQYDPLLYLLLLQLLYLLRTLNYH